MTDERAQRLLYTTPDHNWSDLASIAPSGSLRFQIGVPHSHKPGRVTPEPATAWPLPSSTKRGQLSLRLGLAFSANPIEYGCVTASPLP